MTGGNAGARSPGQRNRRPNERQRVCENRGSFGKLPMSWQGVEGHDEVVERFRRVLAANRLASSFLFVGPAGVGKRLFAEKLAQALLCPNVPAGQLAPCGT